MIEDIIKYDTAVLGNEKGFNYKVNQCFNMVGELLINNIHGTYNGLYDWNSESFFYDEEVEHKEPISAPTQSLLKKWLRKKHCIHIEPQFSRNRNDDGIEWWCYLYPNYDKSGGRIKLFPSEYGEGLSFEEALEIGLVEGLKLITDE